MINANSKKTPMISKIQLRKGQQQNPQQFPYREAVGELFYLVTFTRPDLAQSVGYLSRFSSCPGEEHWEAVKRVLRYIKGTINHGLFFPIGDGNKLNMDVFSDSDYAGDKNDYRSTTGFVIKLENYVIDYGSSKQKSVSCSSCEAEYVACGHTVRRAMWLRKILLELRSINDNNPISIKMDSQSSLQLAINENYSGRAKHIGVQHHFIKELIIIKMEWISTHVMIADMFTKSLDYVKFNNNKKKIMSVFESAA